MNIKQKLLLALGGYVGLGLLAWLTLTDQPIQVFDFQVRLRTFTLVILGLFVFRSLLYFYRTRIDEADAKRRGEPE